MGKILNTNIIEESLIKRKCLVAIPTICNECKKKWIDKVYENPPHKAICPHCGKLNGTLDGDDFEKQVEEWGKMLDAGMMGKLGIHVKKSEFLKEIYERLGKTKKLYEKKIKGRKI